jgi:hypothetical protein
VIAARGPGPASLPAYGWPTIPQVEFSYIPTFSPEASRSRVTSSSSSSESESSEELIRDIVEEMYHHGELAALVEKTVAE